MLIRGKDIASKLDKLEPPFDAETERELIAIAVTEQDKRVHARAVELVRKHVPGAEQLERVLGKNFPANVYEPVRCEQLRSLDRSDRGLLAVAMIAHGSVGGRGVAFEESAAYAREALPAMVEKKLLHVSCTVTTLPDVLFDELPRLRAKSKFDELKIQSEHLTSLPPRFVEFAPFLRKLWLEYTGLEELPDVVCECTHLVDLMVRSEDELKRLNPRLVQLVNLEVLHLSASKLTAVPAEVCALPNLKQLTLQCENIRTLPPEITKLPKLKKLDIRYSKLAPAKVKALLPRVRIQAD